MNALVSFQCTIAPEAVVFYVLFLFVSASFVFIFRFAYFPRLQTHRGRPRATTGEAVDVNMFNKKSCLAPALSRKPWENQNKI